MMKKLLLIAFVSLLAGCFGAREIADSQYFVPSLTLSPANSPIPRVLTLRPFQLSPHLMNPRLAARVHPSQIEYYSQYRWAGALDRLLMQETGRALRGHFLSVSDESKTPSDWILTGTVERFEEEDQESQWFALVGISLALHSSNDQLIWKEYLEVRKKASARNPQAVVVALGEAYSELLATALTRWKESVLHEKN